MAKVLDLIKSNKDALAAQADAHQLALADQEKLTADQAAAAQADATVKQSDADLDSALDAVGPVITGGVVYQVLGGHRMVFTPLDAGSVDAPAPGAPAPGGEPPPP